MQFQCVPTTYVFPINEFFTILTILNYFIALVKSACRNKQVFMQFVMHLKDNNRLPTVIYSEIFARILFFANSVKKHICDVRKLQLGNNLLISVNDRVNSRFPEHFILTKLRICEVLGK